MTEICAKKRYRNEAPEGGWGLLICVGMALPFTSALASMPSFGLVFGDFLKDLGEETSAIALITSLFFSAMSFAGLCTSMLFKKFSIRTVGLAGGICYFVGSLLQIFVQSTIQLLFAFSILQGAAFGLMMPTAYTTFNNYFVKRRVTMMSVAQSMIGIGTMLYPVIMQKLLVTFGFRGCLAVLAALNGHAVFGMLVMHPVEWHMKKVPIGEEELKDFGASIVSDEKEKEEDVLPTEPLVNRSVSNGSLTKKNMSKDSSNELIHQNDDKISGGESNIRASGNAVVQNRALEKSKSRRGIWQIIVDYLDLTLFKDPIYVNIAFGISFALYSDVAFFTIQPLYLFELGFPKADTANIIAIGAAADLAARLFLAVSSTVVSVKARYIYLAGALFTVISRFAFLAVFDFMGMAIITAIMGFLRTWVHLPLPLVFAEYLPKERFPSGYGLFMFLQGNITFAIGPIVGYVRDVTGSYVITFHCLNFFMAACAVPWLIEVIYLRFREKRNSRNKQITRGNEI